MTCLTIQIRTKKKGKNFHFALTHKGFEPIFNGMLVRRLETLNVAGAGKEVILIIRPNPDQGGLSPINSPCPYRSPPPGPTQTSLIENSHNAPGTVGLQL